jgi:tryptophan-rich sensory protein
MKAARRTKAIVVAALAALAVAALGVLSTDLGPWYQGLREPSWKPSDIWFGPAWTTIYALAAISGVRAWTGARDRAGRDLILASFAFNAFVNVLWSLLFFRLRRPDWALAEVGVLWGSIVWLIIATGRVSRASGWLLVPYLLWVTFAATLNRAVVQLNAPFGIS